MIYFKLVTTFIMISNVQTFYFTLSKSNLIHFYFIDNYKEFMASGFSDPYVDHTGLPTLVPGDIFSNNLNSNRILDHIFYKGFNFQSSEVIIIVLC